MVSYFAYILSYFWRCIRAPSRLRLLSVSACYPLTVRIGHISPQAVY